MLFQKVEKNKEEKKNQIKIVAIATHLISCYRHACRHHDDGDKFVSDFQAFPSLFYLQLRMLHYAS